MRKQAVVTITSLSHDGRGIAHQEGKTIFVEGGLIGEEVEIEYRKRKSRYDEAVIKTLLKSAPNRQVPVCDFFELCGGCSLQHMDGEVQITHKQTILLEQLAHIGGVKPKEVLPATLAASYGYRRKARLGVRYVIKKEKLLIGFREKKGRYLADIDSCSVLHPSIGQKIPLLRNFLLQLDNHLHIPQLEIAAGDDVTAIIIRHMKPFSSRDFERMKEFAIDQHYHLYLQPGGPETTELLFPLLDAPRLAYRLGDYDLEILFHPTDFTQVNAEINSKLIKIAIDLLAPKPEDNLLDLFCGIGNFTLPLARFCKKVIGIEGSEIMVARGYENAAHNHIKNIEFHCQNLADNNYNDKWLRSDLAGILLDPPRGGAFEIMQHIPATSATRVVYVSCNPATLARDAGYLCQHGFKLHKVGVLDMFPHTSHVESIALFERE